MLKHRRPIFLQVSGRLGNQLFQIAFAHRLAHLYNRKIQLVTDSIHYPLVSNSDLISIEYQCAHILPAKNVEIVGKIVRIFDKLNTTKFAPISQKILQVMRVHRQLDSHEKGPGIIGIPLLITGFYINKEHVEEIEKELFDEIEQIVNQETKNSQVIPKLLQLGDYQMMHIRRGDYVNNKANFGLLSPKFYLDQKENLPLVLSIENESDVKGFRDLLKPALILTKENSTVWETLKAMSLSRDLVMSNSTFAWWGGFLAVNNGGVARLPDPFFDNTEDVTRHFNYRLFSAVESSFGNE
jgi:hypothetical protein